MILGQVSVEITNVTGDVRIEPSATENSNHLTKVNITPSQFNIVVPQPISSMRNS